MTSYDKKIEGIERLYKEADEAAKAYRQEILAAKEAKADYWVAMRASRAAKAKADEAQAKAEAAERKLDDIYLPAGCGAGEKMRAMNAKGQE